MIKFSQKIYKDFLKKDEQIQLKNRYRLRNVNFHERFCTKHLMSQTTMG